MGLWLPVGQTSEQGRRQWMVMGLVLKNKNQSHLTLQPCAGNSMEPCTKCFRCCLTIKFQLNTISEQVMSRKSCLIVLIHSAPTSLGAGLGDCCPMLLCDGDPTCCRASPCEPALRVPQFATSKAPQCLLYTHMFSARLSGF